MALSKVPRGPQRGAIQGAAIAGITVVLIGVVLVRTTSLRNEFPQLKDGSPLSVTQVGAPAAR